MVQSSTAVWELRVGVGLALASCLESVDQAIQMLGEPLQARAFRLAQFDAPGVVVVEAGDPDQALADLLGDAVLLFGGLGDIGVHLADLLHALMEALHRGLHHFRLAAGFAGHAAARLHGGHHVVRRAL